MRIGYSFTLLTMSIGIAMVPSLEQSRIPSVAAAPHHAHPDKQPRRLAVRVNGAVNPEAISDQLAYRHFMKTVIVDANASAKDIAVRDAMLLKVGLSEPDRVRFLATVHGVKDQLNAIERARKSMRPNDRAAFVALQNQHFQVLDTAVSNVLSSLQPEGMQRLEQFIREQVKRHIVVYGDPKPIT